MVVFKPNTQLYQDGPGKWKTATISFFLKPFIKQEGEAQQFWGSRLMFPSLREQERTQEKALGCTSFLALPRKEECICTVDTLQTSLPGQT